MTAVRDSVAVRVLEKLKKLGQVGALVSELGEGMNASSGTVMTSVHRLRARGLIASHPHPSRYANNRLRWYAAEHIPPCAPSVEKVEPGFNRKREAVVLKNAAQEIDTSRAKVTKCPGYTHNHRYQVAPGAAVVGAGFAAMGVGRYLDRPQA